LQTLEIVSDFSLSGELLLKFQINCCDNKKEFEAKLNFLSHLSRLKAKNQQSNAIPPRLLRFMFLSHFLLKAVNHINFPYKHCKLPNFTSFSSPSSVGEKAKTREFSSSHTEKMKI
jgi:hypothetical protein